MCIRRSVLTVFVVTCILASSALYEHLRLIDSEPDELAFQNAAAIWYEAARTKNLHMMTALYTRTARLLPFTAPVAVGKENVRLAWDDLMSNPGFAVVIGNDLTEIAVSDDLRYYINTLEVSLRDSEDRVVTCQGKHIMVWKMQPNGEWKASVDVFNVSL